MALSLRLDLRQSQSLVMTPQLQQAIKLLQLPNLELAEYVQQELEQNPLLEQDDRSDDDGPSAETPAATSATDSEELAGAPALEVGDNPGDGWAGSNEDGWADSYQDQMPGGLGIDHMATPPNRGLLDLDDRDITAQLTRPKSLREHLIEQLHVDVPEGPERMIGLHLIDLVDEAGYIRSPLDEISLQLGCTPGAIEAVLARLQQFDPVGVCARSLAECLALQLRDANRLDPAMAALLDHLDLLAVVDFATLVKTCGVLPDDLPEMIAELKALNPKPGLGFAAEPVDAVVPDVFVTPLPGGAWRVELNTATLPRVLVNRAYHIELAKHVTDKAEKAYISERFQSANWLIKALDQRARTMLRVAEAVVERQLAFLRFGVNHLRPLVLRDIAEAIELHESTVSRATADKYIATPRGNFPFRYFFTNGLPGVAGEASHSSEAIRQQIKTMIEREDPTNVLSDDQIVGALHTEGVVIARRTVAKYRESLGISSSVQRRRAKALKLA